MRYGQISKEGAAAARHVLCEAAWIVVRYPSPLRAVAERTAAKRGQGRATVALARKLVVLCWHLLTKDEDDAFGRPTLTRKKLASSSSERVQSAAVREGAAWRASRRSRSKTRRRSNPPSRPRRPTGGSSPTGRRLEKLDSHPSRITTAASRPSRSISPGIAV